ncbi:MAG: hypothetical protein ABJZ69_12780 [Hyphomicrobiales bacterium]
MVNSWEFQKEKREAQGRARTPQEAEAWRWWRRRRRMMVLFVSATDVLIAKLACVVSQFI